MNPDGYMAKAAQAVESARLLLAAGDMVGACNRAYYAMFNAAHAALLWADAKTNPGITKTHSGLIAAVGQSLVKPGLLSIELGRSLNRMERMRLLADYTSEAIPADKAAQAVIEAELFLVAVRQFGQARAKV